MTARRNDIVKVDPVVVGMESGHIEDEIELLPVADSEQLHADVIGHEQTLTREQ